MLINKDSDIKSYSNIKVIVADTDLNTFSEIAKLNNDFCFINLSSDFAVNFVIEYERIDCLVISSRMQNLNNLIAKANKRKIKVFIIGKDIGYPLKCNNFKDVLMKGIENILNEKKPGKLKDILKSLPILSKKNNIFTHRLKNSETTKTDKTDKKDAAIIQDKEKSLKKIINVPAKFPESKQGTGEKEVFENNEEFFSTLENISNTGAGDNNTRPKAVPEELNILLNNNISSTNNYPKHSYIGSIQSRSVLKTEYLIKTIKQKVITVIKAKGGVGSTTISIFLAMLFKDIKTLIIDLNFNEGGSDIGYYLDMPMTPNLMVFAEGFDRDAFTGSVLKFADKIDIIQSPSTFLQSKSIDLKDIYNLTDIARKKYDLIIFDLPNNINDFFLGVIDLADLLVMVSDCTYGSIGRLLNINDKFIYSETDKILVLNKLNSANPLKISTSSLKDYFKTDYVVIVKEMDALISKSDFKYFNFNNYENFRDLSNLAKELITK